MALPLIDKQDSFEIVRDQIGVILAAEILAQKALAVLAAKDPLDWAMSIYIERDLPLEQWLNSDTAITDATAPVCNVWVEGSNIDPASSSAPAGFQRYDVTYNLDVVARGFASNNVAGGHNPADADARFRCQAAVRLIRNILSATENRRLLLPLIVNSYPVFENLDFGPVNVEEFAANIRVWNCRCRFRVSMIETAPEFTDYDTLNLIKFTLSDDSQVLFETDIT